MHVLGTIASSKPTAVANSFESIATLSLSGLSTATFSSIPSTYKHLQLRGIARSTGTTGITVTMRFNGDTASNYTSPYINANGTSLVAGAPATTTSATLGVATASFESAGMYAPFEANIYNYNSTSQFKHAFVSNGKEVNTSSTSYGVYQSAPYWASTSAITSITILINANTFDTNSTIALYGIKG